ncbi:hypothetical protein F5X99DRAFT_408556 [Biscogniauxia marginata]|nr:hypothetical protein F5X99DRAFT_408556 [Biscogniauxia marginata]
MEQFEFHAYQQHPGTGAERGWRWQAGAANAQQHAFAHDYVEEIFIEGDLADVRRGGRWEAGAYAYRKPGMEHGPFCSEKGCLMFIVILPVEEGTEKKEVVTNSN